MKIIDFNEIYKNLLILQPNIKISYLTVSDLEKVRNFPLKEAGILQEMSLEYWIQLKKNNGICLMIMLNGDIKITNKEYPVLDSAVLKILSNINELKIKELFYLNKKFAAVTAGLGQYGKNQLVYNESFGFSHTLKTYLIYNPVINLPIRKPANYSYIDLCTNCNECIKNCPAKAIHSDDYPGWLNEEACRGFYNFGNHEFIPSMKYGINAFLGNKFTDEEIQNIHNAEDFEKLFGLPYHEDRVEINNHAYIVDFKYCKECQNQLPCRKMTYTYDKNYYRVVREVVF